MFANNPCAPHLLFFFCLLCSKTTLAHICLHVENVKRPTKESLFPEYNCLILSPANFWQQSSTTFNRDTNLLNTIFQHHVRSYARCSSPISERLINFYSPFYRTCTNPKYQRLICCWECNYGTLASKDIRYGIVLVSSNMPSL